MGFRSNPQLGAVREAIREYPQLAAATNDAHHYLQQIRDAREGIGTVGIDLLPSVISECSRLVNKEASFMLAWRRLNEEQRQILSVYHWKGLSRQEAVDELCDTLHCSDSTVERRYMKALQQMQKHLEAWDGAYSCQS